MEKIVYTLDNNLYINLTNRCSNACEFCVRNGKDAYYGNELWLSKEPTADEVIAKLTNLDNYNEFVFCGFGEPTYRIDEIEKIGKFLRQKSKRVRLNTNGQGNLINGYDITEKLKNAVDIVSISLNEATAKRYQEICHSIYGESAFDALIDFAVLCRQKGIQTVFSVVDSIGVENVEKCRKIANDNNIELKVRRLIEDS